MKSERSNRSYSQGARAESAEATGRKIIDAFLARLMEQWYDEITLDRVAADAGVTVQTIVRRFGGKEGLLDSAAKALAAQINAQRVAPTGDIVNVVGSLIADYEQTGDAVIRLLALEARHPVLKELLDFGRSEHRLWVSSAFAEPLDKIHADSREVMIDALVIATDVYTWKILRRDMTRSTDEASATIVRIISAAIAEFSQHQ